MDTGNLDGTGYRVYKDTGNLEDTGHRVYKDKGNLDGTGNRVYMNTGNLEGTGYRVYNKHGYREPRRNLAGTGYLQRIHEYSLDVRLLSAKERGHASIHSCISRCGTEKKIHYVGEGDRVLYSKGVGCCILRRTFV